MGLADLWARRDREILLAGYVIMLSLPSIFPSLFVAPINIQPHTIAAYDAIEEFVVDGAYVLIENGLYMTAYGVTKQATRDVMLHIFSKPGTKILMYSVQDWGRAAPTLMVEQILPPIWDKIIELRGEEPVYGEDYVIFGWYPGDILAPSLFADRNSDLLLYDYFGTPWDEIPMCVQLDAEAENGEYSAGADVDFLYHLGTWVGEIRVMYQRFQTPIIFTHSGRALPSAIAYIKAGSLIGAVCDIAGAAEYEALMEERLGFPGAGGEGLAAVGGGYTIGASCITMILIGNIFLRKKYKGGKIGAER
jgi:hypothetical protein